MGCKINSCNTPVCFKLSIKNPTTILSSIRLQPKPKTYPTTSSYFSNNKIQGSRQEPIATTTTQNQLPKTALNNIKFQTLEACKLGISRYPDFDYNAEGGSGTATGMQNTASAPGKISVSFDVQTLNVPPLTGETTRFLGLPLPPFLKIDIVPEIFQGTIDDVTGQVGKVTSSCFALLHSCIRGTLGNLLILQYMTMVRLMNDRSTYTSKGSGPVVPALVEAHHRGAHCDPLADHHCTKI